MAEAPFWLWGVIALAAFLQSGAGMGFGVVAGPALLLAFGTAGALQISLVLGFLMALALVPDTLPKSDRRLLVFLAAGICIGTPLGAAIFVLMPLPVLKALAALAVLASAAMASRLAARAQIFRTDAPGRRVAAGAAAGVLSGALAMPGPPIAAYALALKMEAETVRATTLTGIAFAFPLALAAQMAVAGTAAGLWQATAALAAPALLGVLAGYLVGQRLSEAFYRRAVTAILLVSAVALVI